MQPLITFDDLTVLNMQVEDSEMMAVQRLISSASSAVTDAAQSPILERTTTLSLTAKPSFVLRLPGLPIREVLSVTIDGKLLDDWKPLAAGIYRSQGWAREGLEVVTVTYIHGLPEVPEDIKNLVSAMVLAGLLALREGIEGMALNNGLLSSFSIDDYREAYATGKDHEAITPMALTERTKDWLAGRFGGGAQTGTML